MHDFGRQADQEGAFLRIEAPVEAPAWPAAETDLAGPADLHTAPLHPAPQAEDIWLKCWLAAYAPGDPACLDGLPVLLRRSGLSALWLNVLQSPTNLQTPRYEAAPQTVADPARLKRALKRHRAAGLVLEYLPQSDIAAIRSHLQTGGLRTLAMPAAAVPITDCNQSFDHFLQQRSKRERQRSRRLLRLTDEANSPLRFSLITQADQVAASAEQCLRLEQASWKGREGTAILGTPAHARFYRTLAQSLAAPGLLRLALLHDRDGQLVAFELCMVWDRRLIALKTSCSEQHLDLSPGHVLALAHIRHCCADPAIDLYDVTGNGLRPAPHLLRYADRQELLWRAVVFAPGWRGHALHVLWQARLHLRSVKRFVAKQRR